MNRKIALAANILIAVCMASCATQQATPPVPASNAPASPLSPQINQADRLQSIVDFLQQGQGQQAEAALQSYLKDMPESKPARYLLTQIDTPIDKLYPSENFTVRLARNRSLGSIARVYLGNAMGFYGLARYNGIAVPAKVLEGQLIRVPKTQDALAAQKSLAGSDLRNAEDESSPAVVTLVASSAAASSTTPSLADRQKEARRTYRDGLIAFQKQDLETAIADWNKTIALDPQNNEAKINLAQALKLRENLKKLRK